MKRHLPPLWVMMELDSKLALLEKWGAEISIASICYRAGTASNLVYGLPLYNMKPSEFEHVVNLALKQIEGTLEPSEPLPSPPAPSPPAVGVIETTLPEIISGTFNSATDKNGTGGTLVHVSGLVVDEVHQEADGDIHISVHDASGQGMITELTPAYQDSISPPNVGQTVALTGYVYCDHAHENESWHFLTCYELHPLTKIE